MAPRRVGIIVPPKYFDTTSKELLGLGLDIDVLTTQIRVDRDFGYQLDEIVTCAGEIEACAVALADAGAEVVLQLGTPFSTAHGWDGANELRSRIEDVAGMPFEMMGLSVIQAARALGAEGVALATGYYDEAWTEQYSSFVTGAGLAITSVQNYVDQGHFPTQEAAFAAGFDGIDPAIARASFAQVAADDSDADVIVIPGMPGKILSMIPELEAGDSRPFVSYFAIWWRCLDRLGLTAPAGSGRLLTSA